MCAIRFCSALEMEYDLVAAKENSNWSLALEHFHKAHPVFAECMEKRPWSYAGRRVIILLYQLLGYYLLRNISHDYRSLSLSAKRLLDRICVDVLADTFQVKQQWYTFFTDCKQNDNRLHQRSFALLHHWIHLNLSTLRNIQSHQDCITFVSQQKIQLALVRTQYQK